MQISEKAAIHGLRRPLWSAMAPNTGDRMAMAKPESVMARPHWPVAITGFSATP